MPKKTNKQPVKTKALTWTTQQARLGDLVEWEKNPVKITDDEMKQLAKSMEKFDHVLPYVAAGPMEKRGLPLLDGHQRKTVELKINGVSPDTLVDVRVPSRKLTEKEREEVVIRLRKNVGEFDFDKLEANFQPADLIEWGFTEKELLGAGLSAPDFKEYDETTADGVEVCECPTCGHKHAAKKN